MELGGITLDKKQYEIKRQDLLRQLQELDQSRELSQAKIDAENIRRRQLKEASERELDLINKGYRFLRFNLSWQKYYRYAYRHPETGHMIEFRKDELAFIPNEKDYDTTIRKVLNIREKERQNETRV